MRGRRAPLLLASAGVLLPSLPLHADTKQWTNALATSSWSDAGNWSPTGVPAANDQVNVTSGIALGQTVNYDFTGSFRILTALTVSHNGALLGTETLVIASGVTLAATVEHVGDSGLGGSNGRGVITQNGGANVLPGTATARLELGENSTDQGTYNLVNGSVQPDTKSSVAIGVAGLGTFNQSGGMAFFDELVTLKIGVAQGSQGVYNLTGGTLSGNVEQIGIDGFAAFVHSAGTHSIDGLNSSLTIGADTGGVGSYNLSGTGTLTLVTGTPEVIGSNGGAGFFTQSGGTHTLSGSAPLQLGVTPGSGSTGTYSLNAGTLSSTTESIGLDTTGTFNQTGGEHDTGPSFIIGVNSSSNGTYNHSGGLLAVTGSIVLGSALNATGNYNISGEARLSASSGLTVGSAGAGHVTQSGGSVTVTHLAVGGSTGAGTYALSDGMLTVTSTVASSTETVGSLGVMTQTGGINDTGALQINDGSYTQNGGTLILQDAGTSISGLLVSGNGTFAQGGGVLTGSQLHLNDGASGQSHLNLSGGFASFPTAAIANVGPATVMQTGGTLNAGTLTVAQGAVGSYTLTAGTLSAFDVKLSPAAFSSSLTVGAAGVATVTGTLTIGASGTVNSSGALNLQNATTSGSFFQSGPLTVGGAFTNLSGSTTLTGGPESWANGAKLVVTGGSVQLFANPGSDTTYNADATVTPAAGGSALISINPGDGDLVQLRSLAVNAPGVGGNGLVVIQVATGGHASPTTHFGAAGGSVRVYLGDGAGNAAPAPRAVVEALWKSSALDGYWAQRNGKVASVVRGITLAPAVVPAGSRNGLVILTSPDDSGHSVTYLGEDIEGDANGDAKVDVNDVGVVLQHLNTTPGTLAGESGFTLYTPAEGDVNGDLTVDVNDLSAVLANLNQVYTPAASTGGITPVPEPDGAVILVVAAVTLVSRRRSIRVRV